MARSRVYDTLTKGYVALMRSIEDGMVDVEAISTAGNFGNRVIDDELHESSFKKLAFYS